MRTRLRSKFTLFFIVCAALLAVGGTAMALVADTSGSTSGTTAAAPTIQSDKADYGPGELVTLTGSGWQPGEAVRINVNDDAGQSWSRTQDVTADASGNISDSFNLPNWFVATYKVTATGASGTANTTFTDASVSVKTNGVSGATVSWTKYPQSNDCAVSNGSANGSTSGSQAVTNSSFTSVGGGVNDGQSMKLTAPAVSGFTFSSWSGAVSSTSNPVCVPGVQGGGIDLQMTANYVPATVNTTTTASNKTATYGDSSVQLTATVTPASGTGTVNTGTVTFTVKKGTTTIGPSVTSGTVSNGSASASFSLSNVNADTYTIEAVYNAGSGFNGSNNSTQSPAPTLIVGKANQTITFNQPTTPQTFGATFNVNPTSDSNLAVTVAASGGCSVQPAQQGGGYDVTMTSGTGNCVLTASQDGNDNYSAAANVERTVAAQKKSQTITFTAPSGKIFGDADFNPGATASSGLEVTYASSTTSFCTIVSGKVHIVSAGDCTITASQAGNTNYNAAPDVTRTFSIGSAPTTTTVTVTPGSQQYSDLVTLSATVSGPGTPTGSVQFKIDGNNVGTPQTISGGSASLSNYQLTQAPGNHSVTAVFTSTSSNWNNSTSAAKTLTETQETATAGFNGPLFYAVPSGSANVTLSAVINDPADGNRGDITKANVTFVNRDAAGQPAFTGCANRPVALLTSGDTTVGVATCTVPLPFATSGSTQYTVGIKVGGYYVDDNSAENSVVTVSQAVNGMITGGGTLVNTNSFGQYAGTAGQKTNFGFNVKYTKSLTNLQGNINTIVRSGGRVYQIKGNAMSSLTTTPCSSGSATTTCPAKATFNGKANLQDITNPLAPVSLGGNLPLQVTMTDSGEPGSSDTIGIQQSNSNGSLLFSSKWSGTNTVEQLLGGGNLVVR
jgi:hypothetical protein